MYAQRTSKNQDVVYQDVLDGFDSVRRVKGFVVTCSNLVVIWKVWPHMGILS